jgi:predicted nucleotide-binding protein (sugar kinase/HSP70/actin superfamily)
MNLIKEYLQEDYICELLSKYKILERFRYSKKIQNLIDKLEDKKFEFPHEKKTKKETGKLTIIGEAIKLLKDDFLKPIKKIEDNFDKGKIEIKQAVKKIKELKKRLEPKRKELVKFLQKTEILPKADWRWLINTAVFLPMAFSGIKSMINN